MATGKAASAAVVCEDRVQQKQDRHGKFTVERKPKPSVISVSIIETDIAHLEDGSIVEMIEDPENSCRTLFAIFKNGEMRIADQIKSGERILRPIPREEEIVRHILLPRGVKPYESVRSLLCRMNEEILSRCLDLENSNRALLACFILSTWFIDTDRMPVAPYLALVGLPASGKSTVLRILRLLCRRSLLTADISSAAFYRACERLTPTLLIDETATAGRSRDLNHLLRTGTSRDVVALRKDQSFKAYGAKVVAWNELPNDSALNSRCVIVPMYETTRTDLKSPNDPDIVAAADDIQKELLQYRLERFNSVSLPKTADGEPLRSRFRDLYNALGLALAEDTHYCDWLLHCFKFQQQFNREPLLPNHAAVLGTLYRVIHIGPRETYPILHLTGMVNADLQEAGESRRLTPRGVGAALSSLGITTRTRTNQGWLVWLNRDAQKRIHDLVVTHGLDNEFLLPDRSRCKQCDLCDPSKDLRNYRMFDYGMDERRTPQLNPPFQKAG